MFFAADASVFPSIFDTQNKSEKISWMTNIHFIARVILTRYAACSCSTWRPPRLSQLPVSLPAGHFQTAPSSSPLANLSIDRISSGEKSNASNCILVSCTRGSRFQQPGITYSTFVVHKVCRDGKSPSLFFDQP